MVMKRSRKFKETQYKLMDERSKEKSSIQNFYQDVEKVIEPPIQQQKNLLKH